MPAGPGAPGGPGGPCSPCGPAMPVDPGSPGAALEGDTKDKVNQPANAILHAHMCTMNGNRYRGPSHICALFTSQITATRGAQHTAWYAD